MHTRDHNRMRWSTPKLVLQPADLNKNAGTVWTWSEIPANGCRQQWDNTAEPVSCARTPAPLNCRSTPAALTGAHTLNITLKCTELSNSALTMAFL